MMMDEKIKEILEKPFASSDIGKDYNKNDYVKPHLVIRRLNKAFGQDGWLFVPEERIVEHDTIIQFGKLGIRGEGGEWIWKHNCGARRCAYIKGTDKRLDVGNDYKSAVSNCLKRCAMMLGIALDLYGDPEVSERGTDSPQKEQNAPNKPSGEKRQGKGTGSAEGGKEKPSGAKVEALKLQREYMIAHSGMTDKQVRHHFLGTEDMPNSDAGWATYRDLMTTNDPGNLEDEARAR